MSTAMPILYQKFINREDLKKNPSVLYLFGDNDQRAGIGKNNQATEMRGEPNAAGIRTKKAPRGDPDAFWSDRDFESNCAKIEEDLTRVKAHLRRGGILVIPLDGIGTGFAQMERRCPKTFNVLRQSIDSLHTLDQMVKD